jgi:hypothetical protein
LDRIVVKQVWSFADQSIVMLSIENALSLALAAWVGIKFGIKTISTLSCGIFLVEYAWKMFSLRHYRIDTQPHCLFWLSHQDRWVELSFRPKPSTAASGFGLHFTFTRGYW